MMRVSKSSNQNYLRERPNINVSTQIVKEFYGSTIVLLYLKIINFVNKSLMEYIYLNSLSILVAPKCIKIFDILVDQNEKRNC
jgi:hypothetical protein